MLNAPPHLSLSRFWDLRDRGKKLKEGFWLAKIELSEGWHVVDQGADPDALIHCDTYQQDKAIAMQDRLSVVLRSWQVSWDLLRFFPPPSPFTSHSWAWGEAAAKKNGAGWKWDRVGEGGIVGLMLQAGMSLFYFLFAIFTPHPQKQSPNWKLPHYCPILCVLTQK